MREYGPGHPLVFSHIPKTAGTALTAALHRALQPEVFASGIDRSLTGDYEDFDAFSATARDMMFLSPEELPADATLVAGHIGPATTMARYPGADHISFLRNPQSRLLSQWIHSRSLTEFDLRHWGPAAELFRVGWLPLAEYLEHPLVVTNTDNVMARYFTWPHPGWSSSTFIHPAQDDEIAAAAIARIDAMAHVDVVENPDFVSRLGAWLGRPLEETRLNERAFIPKRMRPDFAAELDPATCQLLAERTRIDERLWRHVAQRVLPGQDLDAVLQTSFDRAIQRYVDSFENPAPSGRPVRRAVAFAYNLAKR